MKGVRRIYIQGALCFFTVVTYKRRNILCKDSSINRLRLAFRYTMRKYPFKLRSIVILPDHLHCIWRLPENDSNFSIRWSSIKNYFSIGTESSKNNRNEKQIWQPRFLDHLIRDEQDLKHHLDYIYYNPVKHGLVNKTIDWKWSTFKREVMQGFYDADWGNNVSNHIKNLNYE